jgi:hypothetical protein
MTDFDKAPVHTDACTEYVDTMQVIETKSSDVDEPSIYRKVTTPREVKEQRLSHFLMFLLILGTMTRPLLVALSTTPRALYAGVFFVVGAGSVLGNNLTSKAIFLLSERRFISPAEPLLTIGRGRVAYFLFWQALTVAITVAMSQTLGAIGFPVVITLLIPFRWVVIPKMFTVRELEVMDALTADNPVVLASLGGAPEQEKSTQDENERDDRSASSSATAREKVYREELAVGQRERKKGVKHQRVGDIER